MFGVAVLLHVYVYVKHFFGSPTACASEVTHGRPCASPMRAIDVFQGARPLLSLPPAAPPVAGPEPAEAQQKPSRSPAEAASGLMAMMMQPKKTESKNNGQNDDDSEKEPKASAPAKSVNTKKGTTPKAKKPQGPTRSKHVVSACVAKVLPKFPGVPKAGKDYPAMEYKDWRIYTAVQTSAWRCKKSGVRSDTSCSWKVDATSGWAKVIKTITQK